MKTTTNKYTRSLQRASRTLKNDIAKYLKLKRHTQPELTEHFAWRRCFCKYHYKGTALELTAPLVARGFKVKVDQVADEKVIRILKTFVHRGIVHTAKVTIIPSMNRLTVSVSTEPTPL